MLRILSNVQRLHRNWQLKNCSLMFLPIQVRSIIENLTCSIIRCLSLVLSSEGGVPTLGAGALTYDMMTALTCLLFILSRTPPSFQTYYIIHLADVYFHMYGVVCLLFSKRVLSTYACQRGIKALLSSF